MSQSMFSPKKTCRSMAITDPFTTRALVCNFAHMLNPADDVSDLKDGAEDVKISEKY